MTIEDEGGRFVASCAVGYQYSPCLQRGTKTNKPSDGIANKIVQYVRLSTS